MGENRAESQQIVAAAELLGRLLLQDVERTDDGVSLKDGVSRDRMMSVHDPEMRHGHKSSSRRFDGYKTAIVVGTGTQLITAVEVLPGNAPDNLEALELVEQSEANTGVLVVEAIGDAAYGDGDTRQAFADATRHPACQGAGSPQPVSFSQGRLPYRPGGGHLHLSGGGSRRFDGYKAAIVVGTGTQLITAVEVLPGNAPDNLEALELVEQSEANTGVLVVEAIGDAAYGDGDTRQAFADATRHPGKQGAGSPQPVSFSQGRLPYRPGCSCTRRKRCCSTPGPCCRVRLLANTGSAGWWWSIGWRGWFNWESASPATSGAPRPGSSCTWRPRWPT